MKVAKSLFSSLLALALWTAPAAAGNVSNLRQVQVSGGSQIDLLFDGRIQKSQIQTEFFNDIIQVSLTDASVYPAKISSVSGGNVAKVFAYQYAPKLVRCRLTVKGKAEDFNDKLVLNTDGSGGKILSIRVGGAVPAAAPGAPAITDRIAAQAGHRSPATAAEPPAPSSPSLEERALLNRVLAADAPAAAAPSAPREPAVRGGTENLPIHTTPAAGVPGPGAALAGGKPLPSPLRAFGKMGLVLALFGLLAFGLKRYARGRGRASDNGLPAEVNAKGLLGAISSFAKKGLGKERMIEVLSTHYLGPKKSIAVVRIAGKTMVLGIASDSINLISQLEGDADALLAGEGEGPDLSGIGGFSDLLVRAGAKQAAAPSARPAPKLPIAPAGATARYGQSQYGATPTFSAGAPAPAKPAVPSARQQIRSRMEGMKPL